MKNLSEISQAGKPQSGCSQNSAGRVQILTVLQPISFKSDRLLGILAAKYIWWKTPEETIAMPQRLIAQVMNLGDYADVQALAALLGDATLRDVLNAAEIGQFNERSWRYWHYRLGLAPDGAIPPLSARRFA